jgi:2-polyprenyl-3-methyl-5-hydroxy-6-metoxy-1,4-benzoquinol methylase
MQTYRGEGFSDNNMSEEAAINVRSSSSGASTDELNQPQQQQEQYNSTNSCTIEKNNGSCKQSVPRRNDTYTKVEYWDERFQMEEEYDWYCSYADVSHQIAPFLKQNSSRILMLGCGNSKFSEELYHSGYPNIVNIDYSRTVIHQMRLRHQDKPSMEWKESQNIPLLILSLFCLFSLPMFFFCLSVYLSLFFC